MGNKLLSALTNNIGTKIMAVVIATLLWLVVYNLDDPNKMSTFSANVTVVNAEYIADQNLCYEVLDGTNTVSFTVTTKRSNLERLENSNFTATADMSNMVMDEGGQSATVPIDITSSLYSREITYGSKKYLKIGLENLMSKQFVVSADSTGEVEKGCAVGALTVTNPTMIKVSGPESIVSKINKVVAVVDVSDMAIDFSDNVVPDLLNKKGKEIDATRLTLSNRTVTVSAQILNMKEVALNYQTSGEPADHYQVADVSVDHTKIKVKGTAAALNALTAIDIPGEALNVSGLTGNLTTEVDITEYLPEGVELVDVDQRVVTVTIKIEEYQTRTFSVPTSNIALDGMEEGMKVTWARSYIDVPISALKSQLDALDAGSLRTAVDLTGLAEGGHRVRLQVDLGEDYTVDRVLVSLTLSK